MKRGDIKMDAFYDRENKNIGRETVLNEDMVLYDKKEKLIGIRGRMKSNLFDTYL